jgi:excisionase family DNA binding protein
MDRMATVAEVAEALGVTKQRVQQLLSRGRIRGARRFGERSWMIPVSADGNPEVIPRGGEPERTLRDLLAKQIGGRTEVAVPFGTIDVCTEDTAFEVEHEAGWRSGIRQVLASSAQCGLKPALALFGASSGKDVEKRHSRLVEASPHVQLWWFDGSVWVQITGPEDYRDMGPSNHVTP